MSKHEAPREAQEGMKSLTERQPDYSIELPQGGATAASPFVCKNVGGLPCIEGLHLQDCIAEGTWGNESPHFGYNLSRLWNLAFLAFLAFSEFGISSVK